MERCPRCNSMMNWDDRYQACRLCGDMRGYIKAMADLGPYPRRRGAVDSAGVVEAESEVAGMHECPSCGQRHSIKKARTKAEKQRAYRARRREARKGGQEAVDK